ncbi:MFS transporter [Salinibacterium sp. ZJ70]|uniref:MFS transporter n=1 Tax=Salinibacterium sp. ZJ70 TaxID=2708084 RepID=UPI00141FF24C|nr:MFS transporter [Salinibacterium sp. ZJ70]
MTAPDQGSPGLFVRIRIAAAEPVLRSLGILTAIGTLGRGVVLALVVLYLSLIVGLTASEVALVVAIGAGVGVGAAYLGGRMADSVSARKLLAASTAVCGLAVIAYALVGDAVSALVVQVLGSSAWAFSGSVRSAIIARAFEGHARVMSRAVLRSITNLGIAVGGGAAAIALIAGTPEAYRIFLVAAGLAYVGAAGVALRLPARVDAPKRSADAPGRVGRSPWTDRRYLAFSVLASVFGMQFAVADVGVPLWIAQSTEAPEALVAVLLVINTTAVILLQVPLSRGTHDLRRAGLVSAIAGVLMALACVAYGASAAVVLGGAIVLLVLGALLHAFAEILSQAASWSLSFELADPARAGAYQGIFSMSFSAGATVAPLVIALTLANGMPGWIALAAVFAISASGVSMIAVVAARRS